MISRSLLATMMLLSSALLALGCGGGGERVVVAAGTTLVDSGLLDVLAVEYEAIHPEIEISIVPRPTAEVLELGARGSADVLVTHAPEQERRFLADHPDAVGSSIFASRFLLLAPAPTAGRLGGLTVTDAFGALAADEHSFVTRMDGSGTYDAERRIWGSVPIDPRDAAWYDATGSGMGFSLQVADQTGAAILAEHGSFLTAAQAVDLVSVDLANPDDPMLVNPYTAIVLGDSVTPAAEFVGWLLSPDGRDALAGANVRLFGSIVFSP